MTIAQVSKQYDISPDTLRCYKRIGLLPPVPRGKSGIRDQDDGSVAAGKAILAEQRRQLRARMADMQASLDHLDRKIERCEQLLLPIEQELAEKQGGRET